VKVLRRRFPGSPIAVWVGQISPEYVIDVVRAAVGSHIRAILGGAAPDSERLRDELTSSHGLAPFILRWASDAGYLREDVADTEIRMLLDVTPSVRTLKRLASERREATRTWRGRLRHSGLPAPRAWLGLAHTLHLAFHLQRNREHSLQRAAECLGYSDVTLMSHRFRHVFRMPPGAARTLLGAEPLLNLWFQSTIHGIRR
jgi:AraC-like DNA-binding protein